MIGNRRFTVLLSGAVMLALLAGASLTASAQTDTTKAAGPKFEENQNGPNAEGTKTQTRERERLLNQEPTKTQAGELVRERIRERIRVARDLSEEQKTAMQANLRALVRAGVTDSDLEVVFPGYGKSRPISAPTMLRLQYRLAAMAQEGLPVEPVNATTGGTLETKLYALSPNPFTDGTVIQFDVASVGSGVSLELYDVSGRLVRSFRPEARRSGRYFVSWDGRNDDGGRVAAHGLDLQHRAHRLRRTRA